MADPTTPAIPVTAGATLSLSDFWTFTLNTIQAVEAAYPQGGKGKDKFDAVYSQVMAFAPLVTLGVNVLQALLPFFINTAVAFFNKLGIFKTTGTQAADPAPAPAPAAGA